MKQLVDSAYRNGNLYAETVSEITDEATAKEFTIAIKSLIGKMRFPNPQYNLAGATSFGTLDTIYYMVTPEMDARLSVDVLAYAFNMDKAEVNAHKIVVDKFENPNIKAFVFDIRFFNVREQFRVMGEADNPMGLYWNTFYTLSEMFSYSPFFPAIALTTEEVGVTTVSTENANAKRGDEVKLVTTVTGGSDTYVPKEVDYEISGQISVYTNMIPGSNILMIGNDETASTITVTTTSRYNPDVKATSTVTIAQEGGANTRSVKK